MAIPRGLIRKMAASNTVYSQGLSLYAAPFSYKTTPTQFANYYQVTASFPDRHCSTLEIDNEHEWIEKTDCTCSAFAHDKACKHIVALLLKIENDFFSADFARNAHNQAAPETDAGCRQLLAERGEIVKARARQRALFEKAVLTPQISLSGDTVRLGLKAGCGRGYVVRDLEELYQALLHRKIAPCGRADSFLYAPESFQNEEFVRFFMAYYPFCRESEGSKTMMLSPEALDAFFALFNERKIAADTGTLTLTTDIPAFTLWIKPSPRFYRLSLDRRGFEVLKGREQLYIKEANKLYLCGADFSDVCGGLICRFAGKDSDPIILREDMTAFYSLVIKPAARFIHIRSEVRDFIPPALKTRIYLDAHEKSVTARTEFYYDETMYYAFSPNRDLQTVWDIEGETLIENLVKSYFPEPGHLPGTAMLTSDNDSLFQLISEGIPALSRHAVLYISASLKNVRLKPFPAPTMGVRVESGLLKLDVTAGDLPPAVLAAALAAYRQKKKYIRLKDGSFLLLDTGAM
ncbi:MAG: SNF2 helicase associated domain-containing protein, partial [Clostridia bacterium]